MAYAWMGYYSTDTSGMWQDYQYSNWGYYSPAIEKVEQFTKEQRDRLRLALTRSFYVDEAKPLLPQREAMTFAPRRTVVPRGVVSWVRMGTRRPL